MTTTVNLSASLSGAGEVSATIGARNAATGRIVLADHVYSEIVGSIQASVSFENIEELLRNELPRLPILSGLRFEAFRGRSPPFTSEVPVSREMGPPAHSSSGRYNPSGTPVLYLCDSPEGVLRELQEGEIWIQRFRVPINILRVADLRPTSNEIGTHLGAITWLCDLAGFDGHEFTIESSQRVAGIVAEQFDGFITAGVRGDSHFQYSNLVLFNPCGRWSNWLDDEKPVRHR